MRRERFLTATNNARRTAAELDPEWAQLAREDERWRDQWIADVLSGVAASPDRERRGDLRRMIWTELALVDPQLVGMTLGRLRAWARMEPAPAAAVASAAEAVEFFDLPADSANRLRQATAQALQALSWDELARLERAARWLAPAIQAERRRRPAPPAITRLRSRLAPWVTG